MSERDGGRAFPVSSEALRSMASVLEDTPASKREALAEQIAELAGGMSLRDYFASAALQTMKLANSWTDNPLYWEGVAKSAYVCADEMLKARSA